MPSFIACGLNYKSAPVALREKLVFTPDRVSEPLRDLAKQRGISEAVILSTCNRTELYCISHQEVSTLSDWLAGWHQVPAANLTPYLYVYHDESTVQHVFRVASGMDSMILGEPQIFGQLKEAVNMAEKSGTLGQHLRRLFQHAFFVGKQIRTDTEIGSNPISLGYGVLQLARRIFADLTRCQVLLIGAGETINLVTKHLYANGIKQLCIANRTLLRAQDIAENIGAKVISFSEISEQLIHADIVVTATHSTLPVIGKGMIERTLKLRKHRPILMVDLGMPRNIEPEIQSMEDVYLYALDDLQTLLEENRSKRVDAMTMAESIIKAQSTHFMADCRALKANHMIRRYRNKFSDIRDDILAKALQELKLGEDPQEVLQRFSHKLMKRFLHHPSVNLRQAAYRGEWELIQAAEKLFELEK